MSEIDSSYRVTADELRQFIERIERLDAEKVMRKLITLRKRDQNDIAEEEAILEMYKEALGM